MTPGYSTNTINSTGLKSFVDLNFKKIHFQSEPISSKMPNLLFYEFIFKINFR